MKPTLYLLVFNLCFLGCTRKAVLYGNHKNDNSKDYYAVYIDQYGDYYPNSKLKNEGIRKANCSLNDFYDANPQSFYKEFKTLNIDTTLKTSFLEFQRKLILYHANEINNRAKVVGAESITFIMVGYNNAYIAGKNGSEYKLSMLKDSIYSFLKKHNKKTFIVELFWDGKKAIMGFDALSIFKHATANSYNTGIQLRLLLNELSAGDVYLISHSLGANIICETLFNQEAKIQQDTAMGDLSVSKFLKEKYKQQRYVLKKINYHAAIVAPAIPGENTFCDYAERGYKYNVKSENYWIIAGFNKHDPVLRKFVNIPQYLSSTTFGCRPEELNRVFKIFEKDYDRNKIDTVDFSIRKGKKHNNHDVMTYLDMPQYQRLLEKLYLDTSVK